MHGLGGFYFGPTLVWRKIQDGFPHGSWECGFPPGIRRATARDQSNLEDFQSCKEWDLVNNFGPKVGGNHGNPFIHKKEYNHLPG